MKILHLSIFQVFCRIRISAKNCPHRRATELAYTSKVAHGPCATFEVLGSSVAHVWTPFLPEIRIFQYFSGVIFSWGYPPHESKGKR